MKKHYIIMLVFGTLLLLSLFFKLIPEITATGLITLDILSYIGSGLLCSALVSFFSEKANTKVRLDDLAKQRSYILFAVKQSLSNIIQLEIINLTAYRILDDKGDKLESYYEGKTEEAILKVTNLIDYCLNEIATEVTPDKMGKEWYLRLDKKEKLLCHNLIGDYKNLNKNVEFILANEAVYLTKRSLTEDDLKILKKINELTIKIINASEEKQYEMLYTYKKLFMEIVPTFYENLAVNNAFQIPVVLKSLA